MIAVEMRVAERMDELARRKADGGARRSGWNLKVA
jgi:hypothetical protein